MKRDPMDRIDAIREWRAQNGILFDAIDYVYLLVPMHNDECVECGGPVYEVLARIEPYKRHSEDFCPVCEDRELAQETGYSERSIAEFSEDKKPQNRRLWVGLSDWDEGSEIEYKLVESKSILADIAKEWFGDDD